MKKFIPIIFLLFSMFPASGFSAASLNIEWNPNTEPDLQSYNLYCGTGSRNYGLPIPVGNTTQYTVTGLNEGETCYFAMTAVDTSGNESGYSDELVYTIPSDSTPPAGATDTRSDPFSDDFEDGNFDDWTIVDEGNNYAPSNWKVSNGVLVQDSNIFGGSSNGTEPYEPGTYALNGEVNWTDYTVNLKLRSRDDDGIGIMFRYQDPDNYYLFSMGKQRNYRTITKKVDGVVTELAGDTVPYSMNQWYEVRIEVQGNTIKAYLDDTLLFDVQDDSLVSGKIGLYSWGNTGSDFDDISVNLYGTGDISESAPDSEPPQITIAAPSSTGNYETKQSNITISGTCSDNVQISQVTWSSSTGGSGQAAGLENWSISDAPLQEGSNTITVTASDAEGNRADTSITITYTVPDTTSPDLAIISPVSGGTYETEQASLNISGTATDNEDVVQVNWSNSTGGSGQATGLENWSVSDLSLQEGENIISIFAYDAAGNSTVSDISIIYTLPEQELPAFSDTFDDGTFDDWTIVDEGNNYAPSDWKVSNGVLVQDSNIFGGSSNGTEPYKPGTYALNGAANWADYTVSLKLRSRDDDGIGIMFRYQDPDNYYLFSMGKQRNYRTITKKVDGVVTELAGDTVPYIMNQWYEVRIEVQGNTIKAYLDDTLLFDVQDDSLATGKIGLYSWGNTGSDFDDISVNPIIYTLPEQELSAFSDNFDDGAFDDWTIVDEGTNDGPSDWKVSNGGIGAGQQHFRRQLKRY